MKYKIAKNKKSVTVVITDVLITGAKHLYEHYEGQKKYYFSTGVLKKADYKTDIIPMLQAICKELNELNVLPEGEKIAVGDLLTLNENEYRLFGKNLNKNGEWDKRFKIALKNNSQDPEKKFLFKDFEQKNPITYEESYTKIYAIELEIKPAYNEDELQSYVFAVFHRAFSTGENDETTGFKKNDGIWNNFFVEEDEDEEVVAEKNLPF